jgi:hypothetical protein
VAVAATVGALAVAGPVSGAGAATWPTGFDFLGSAGPSSVQAGVSVSGCSSNGTSVGGTTGGTTATACGALISSVGPAIGQISTVVAPTITGSTVVGPVTASSGNAVVTSGP